MELLDRRDQEFNRTASNGLYGVAATWAIPAFLWTACTAMMSPPLEAFNVFFSTITIALCVMSVIAALKISAGRKSGRLWAFLPIWVLMLSFPIGTMVAYKAYSRLGDASLN